MTQNISLKEFLKTYTAISNKFGIEGSKVVKYLELTYSTKFYQRLRTNYTLNKDYIIKRKNKNQ